MSLSLRFPSTQDFTKNLVRSVIALIFVFAFGSVHSQTTRRFLIDLGDPSNPTNVVGWNNLTTATSGTTISLNDTTGSSSEISFEVITPASNGYGTGEVFNSSGYNGQVLDYPATACGDSHFSYQGGGTYRLNGLDNTKTYTLRIFGSRSLSPSDPQVGTFTINGHHLAQDAVNNTGQTILFTDLTPTPQGTITMDFGVGVGSTFGYLNVLDVREKTIPEFKPSLDPIGDQVVSESEQVSVPVTASAQNVPLNRPNIVILGSSTAGGIGASGFQFAWAYMYGTFATSYEEPFTVINLAMGGFTTRDILPSGNPDRNITKALTYNPVMIIINLPSNDVADNVPRSESLNNLISVKQQAEAAGVKVFITSTQPRNFSDIPRRRLMELEAADIMTAFGDEAIDLYSELTDLSTLFIKSEYSAGDGVHLNDAGHNYLYQTIRNKTESFLNSIRFDFTMSQAPSFISVSNLGQGHGQITIAPFSGSAGSYNNVTLSVMDKNGAEAQRQFNVTVPQSAKVSRFNFTNNPQNVTGWIDLAGQPHQTVISNTDPATGFSVSSIATNQWNPAVYGSPVSAYNGGVTNGTVQNAAVVRTNWFNYNASYGSVVNGVLQQDNIRVSGLNPTYRYKLSIGASRASGGTSDQYGTFEYRLNGSQVQTLLATDNATQQVVYDNVSPDANGRIGLSARKTNGSTMNFGYVGWLVVEEIGSANFPPTANAGPDVVISLPQTSVTLAGSGFDTDGTVETYTWTQLSGGSATLTGAGTSTLTVSGLSVGTYVFELKVTDDAGATATDTVNVVLNSPLTVDAGPDVLITLPQTSATLTGSASDTGGAIESYAWTQLSGGSVTLSGAGTSTLTVSNLSTGTYTFELTVTDEDGVTATDIANIVVNSPPVANAGPDVLITLPQTSVTLTGSGSDSDGSIETYAWTQLSGASVTLSGVSTSTLTISGLSAGIYAFELEVTDNNGVTSTDTMNIDVNSPPIANAGPDVVITLPQTSATLTGIGSDADGTIEAYTWMQLSGGSVTLSGAGTSTLTVSDLSTGTYTFELKVTDDVGATATDTVNIVLNSPLTVDAGPDVVITLPQTLATLTGSASDAGSTIESYAWTQLSGGSVTLSGVSTSILTVSGLSAGTYAFKLQVTNDAGATATDTVNIVVNSPPTANAGPDVLISLPQTSATLTGSASDTDGTIASYLWSQLSGGSVTLSGASTSTLTVSGLSAGTYAFELKATDDFGATSTDTVNVDVNSPPTANAGPDVTITLPQTSAALTGSGVDTDGVIASYLWTQLSGAGATLTGAGTSTLTVSGLSAGTYTFELKVTDDDGATATDAVKIVVNSPPATISRFNFTNALQNVSGWIDLAGQPHQSVISNTDFATGITVSSLATNQWNPVVYGSPISAYNGGVTNGTVQNSAVVRTNWFNFNAPYGATVNGAVQGDNIGISGLNPAHAYKISIGASRGSGGTSDQYGTFEYRLNGSQVQTLLATNNATQQVVYDDVHPNVGGYVGLSARKISGSAMNFGYAGWLVVEDMGVTGPAANIPPVANAGNDIEVVLPTTTAILTGSGSDPDGAVLSYAWTKISGGSVTLSGAGTSTLGLSGLMEGTYSFELKVTDDDGAIDADTVVVTVKTYIPPTANAGQDRTITLPTSSLVITGTAGGTLQSVAWTKVSGGSATLSGTSTLFLSASNLTVGMYVFRLTVTDNIGAIATDDVTVNVNYADVAKFNFSNTTQNITGWTTLGGAPHAQVLEARDANSNIRVNSVATNQWNPVNYGSGPLSSYNGGTANASVQPAAVVLTNWFNYVSPYGATVNGVVQGDNIQILDLVPNQAYEISVGASRASGALAEQYGLMEYRFNGINPQTLLVTNNVSNQVVVTVMSDANGRIGIAARKVNGSSMNFGYIGWLVVTKSDGSGGARLSSSYTATQEENAMTGEEWVTAYPNPAENDLNLQFNQGESDMATIVVRDVTGKTMLITNANLQEGTSNIVLSELKSKGFSPGLYLINVKSSRRTGYLKVLFR